ncbi:MAG: hypothetical protein GY759_04920 [Chloroflexi bacterium]|nr:hypothetical protein [Chloroflexota bacterium]
MTTSPIDAPIEPVEMASTMASEVSTLVIEPEEQRSWLERITIEYLAYTLILVIALAVRLLNLGLRPLAPTEAATALRAWQASRGLGPDLDAGVPLLFSLETLTFFFTGANSALVRVWPVVASVIVILAIFNWRRWIGRDVALLAALLISFSPLLNAFGRRGDGAALALMALAIALAGWARLQEQQHHGWTWLAVGAGLLLISGPAAPAAFLALAIVLLLTWHDAQPLSSPGITTLVLFLGVALVGGTALLTQLSGFGLIALNWSEWFASFNLSGASLLWGFIRLLSDEPLLVIVGIGATIWGVRRGNVPRAFSVAALVVMLIALLQGPYAANSRAIAALMLTVPVSGFLLWLARSGDFRWNDPELILYGIVLTILIALSIFTLISYNKTADSTQLWLMGASVGMAIVLTVVFLLLAGPKRVLSIAAVVAVAFLALFNTATAWGMAYDARPPRFAALYTADARVGLYDLVTTSGDLSQRQRGDRWSLPIALVTGSDADDLLQWYLREASDLRLVESVGLENAPPLVIAPAFRELPLSERYAGQDFALLDAWDPAMGDGRQKIDWIIFRKAPWNIPTQNHILWADTAIINLE